MYLAMLVAPMRIEASLALSFHALSFWTDSVLSIPRARILSRID